MSYRNKIHLITTKEGFEYLEEEARKQLQDNYGGSFIDSIDSMKWLSKEVVALEWKWVKFDDSYSDVELFKRNLEEFGINGTPYRMMIIGENYGEYGMETIECDEEDVLPVILTRLEVEYSW